MSFASASLVHGISVDPIKLFWTAKAWSDNHTQSAYLDGLISGRLQQDTESRKSLPFEILVVIKQAFWLEATRLAECQAWVLFGPATDLSGEIDMDDPRAQTVQCIAGLKRKQRRLQGQAKGCYQCSSTETCHCEARRPHKCCHHSNWYDDLYEAMVDVMRCLPGPCRHKSCHRCQTLQPFLRAFRIHISHVSQKLTVTNWRRQYGCIVSAGQKSRFGARHSDDYTQNSVLEANLWDFEQMADASRLLNDLASDGVLPSCRYPLGNSNPRPFIQERLTLVDAVPAQTPVSRCHLLATSYHETGVGYFSVGLAFGLSVDPVRLLYYARAFQKSRLQLAYLDALISGKLYQDPHSRRALPAEIIDIIRSSFWEVAILDNTCEGWAFYGEYVPPELHSPHCCKQAFDQYRAALQRDACELFCDCNGNGPCLCGRMEDRLGPPPASFNNFTTRWPYSVRHVRDSFCIARDALVACLSGCQRPHCWTCKTLRPYLNAHGIQVGYIADNHLSQTGDSEAVSCVVSCADTRTIETSHSPDDNYEMQTTLQEFDVGDVRNMTENAGHLQALAKRGLLPVVPHPFHTVPETAPPAPGDADRLAKRAQATRPLSSELSIPRFYFSAHSFLNR